jgi:putative 2OG-Fe(II) oxygenase
MNIITLKRNGFVNIGNILTPEENKELVTLAKKTIRELPANHPDSMPRRSGVEGVMRIPQHDKKIADLLDKIFCDIRLKDYLVSLLGEGYKIWQINLRRSSGGDPGLYLHQDAPGETGVCIALDDNFSGKSATCFLTGSHLYPKRMNSLDLWISSSMVMNLKFLFKPFESFSGDVGIFFNRTWHGRFSNKSSESHDMIFIACFPAGHILSYEGYGEWSQDFLNEIKGTELSSLLDPSIGTDPLKDGRYKIKAVGGKDVPYALALEEMSTKLPARLIISVWLLQAIMIFRRPLARLKKKLS